MADNLNPMPGNPFVVNPYESDCKTYIECLRTLYTPYNVANMDVIIKRDCPDKTYFSSNNGKCYYNYRCNQPPCSKDQCRKEPCKFVDYTSGHCENFIECRDDSDTLALYHIPEELLPTWWSFPWFTQFYLTFAVIIKTLFFVRPFLLAIN